MSLRNPDARPVTVLAAVIVTLVATGLVMLVLSVVLFAMLATRSDFLEVFGDGAGMRSSGADTWFTALLVVVVVFILWCAVARCSPYSCCVGPAAPGPCW